ncbi:tRNA pseudouridine(38-40) synthase, variant 1 [Verruconis gallopava]|uniref:tRNA pseudouridine synthase 1 n=1 Tax=Verruconis gallopava TaxID=253628 RepID=A0A0D1XIE1_9PEZI|nr:tRNA pseudouridine(38-40) synthase, variant 1 [Verruconis gallopava]KIW02066.1 tRNA pseudouridine(38-40) synthase, variant 1 [Verruconis gallopava]
MDEEARATQLSSNGASKDPKRGEKRKWENRGGKRQQQGSKRHKGRDMGRSEYFRQNLDKRKRNEESQEKLAEKRNGEDVTKANPFTQEEIESETRQPKRKVAVMMGYAGSGYKGMQMMPNQKTIEGDVFNAFVKAGAISKANADDPKKSSFVRCARTDKGVHAAGNVISLKLIIEDPKIVDKINEHLPKQIRIWGIERVIGSFSCYQACDSRWYEYLIPTHSFLPPHPRSYIGQKLVELAEEAGDLEGYRSRQKETEGFWEKVEEERIKPILDGLEPALREKIEQALYHVSTDEAELQDEEEEAEEFVDEGEPRDGKLSDETTAAEESVNESASKAGNDDASLPNAINSVNETSSTSAAPDELAFRVAIKQLKEAYLLAKRQWRIPEERLKRVQETFALYKGTHNFHNYTIRKSPRDPSAKRHILSFNVNTTPILIGDTEWLSLKVHGQSFMMHQIRKMVGMATLVVRCGAVAEKVMADSFTEKLYSIPKAPALGLLLERPVFDNYNAKATGKFDRGEVSFTKYEKEMEEFKRREIYERIFGEEERENVFHSFFSHVDNFRVPIFLYLSSKGLEACGDARDASTRKSLSRSQRSGSQRKRGRDSDATQENINGDESTEPPKLSEPEESTESTEPREAQKATA